MSQRVLIVLGHPRPDSFCAALAQAYAQEAQRAGHEVRVLRLGELAFDPVLHAGYRAEQALEPDLLAAQEAILWAQHLVWAFPIWWGAMPALLKGFLDRALMPGFAFRYRPNSLGWDRLLQGRSGQLLVTMDTPPWYFRWVYRMPGIHQMKRTVLEFCGVQPVAVACFGSVKGSTPAQRERWLDQARRLASRL